MAEKNDPAHNAMEVISDAIALANELDDLPDDETILSFIRDAYAERDKALREALEIEIAFLEEKGTAAEQFEAKTNRQYDKWLRSRKGEKPQGPSAVGLCGGIMLASVNRLRAALALLNAEAANPDTPPAPTRQGVETPIIKSKEGP